MSSSPELASLIGAPFERSQYLVRVESLIRRYQRIELMLGADELRQRRRATFELLELHPTGILEAERVGGEELRRRGEDTRRELSLLRGAAPIPAPADRSERTRVLALADAEHWLRELRLLDRLARRQEPEKGLAAYHKLARPDHLPIHSVETVLEWQQSSRAGRHRQMLELAGLRHQVDGFGGWLLPPPKQPLPPGTRVQVGRADEVREGKAKRFEIEGRTVAVFRDRGQLYGLDDVCPHRGGPLGKGELEDGCVICPLHGWAFELDSGEMRGNPRVFVPCYELSVEGELLFIGAEKKK